MASLSEFMELAVNMPEHEPHVGHPARSIASTSSSDTDSSAESIITSIRSRGPVAELSGLHRAAADKDGGDIEPHGRNEHAGGHLVAIGYAHHGVGLVGIDHILHRVGDQLARGSE